MISARNYVVDGVQNSRSPHGKGHFWGCPAIEKHCKSLLRTLQYKTASSRLMLPTALLRTVVGVTLSFLGEIYAPCDAAFRQYSLTTCYDYYDHQRHHHRCHDYYHKCFLHTYLLTYCLPVILCFVFYFIDL